jgi:serine/threonine protein kinase
MGSSIEAGTSVSHYRVISAIGAGGMGEVYKAHDVTLERTVALKILPPELVRNDERVRRFMQEAKSASSLNHPNIVTIHEIGEVAAPEGNTSASSIHYIAMELIDGATLKRRIHDGETDLRTLTGYAAQAAEGLAKAHAAGIIHRDLKPENIMITRDGFAKVLDFGLAKLSVKKSASEGNTATDLRGDTREGVIVGTVGYMSPEQVRGAVVDHRSDIFSFGCILYEMATRRRPFEADSDIEVMHKILSEKPPAIDELNKDVPAELRRMIRRCLSKDPEKRYQSMKDLAIELGDVHEEFDELSASTDSRSSGSLSQRLIAPPEKNSRGRLIAVGVIIVALLGVAGVMLWRRPAPAAQKPQVAYGSMKIEQLTSTNNINRAVISPDGKYLAQTTVGRDGKLTLSVLQIATGASVQVVPSSSTPFAGIAFSPDSNYLLYGSREESSGSGYASLFQVPSLGGTPRRLLFDIDTPVSFSPDGKQFAFGRGHPDTGENWLLVANADGTGERKVAAYKRYIGPPTPSWSPDGKMIVTPVLKATKGVRNDLTAFDVATGASRVIGTTRWFNLSSAQWLPDGSGLVVTAAIDTSARSQLWLQPYPAGEPLRITNDLNNYDFVTLTKEGKALTAIRGEREIDVLQVDPASSAAPVVLTPHTSRQYLTLEAAENGSIVVTLAHETGTDIALITKAGEAPQLLTHDGNCFAADISANGQTIVFDSAGKDEIPHLFIINADGSGLKQLTSGDGELAAQISRDGTTVTYNSADGAVWRIPSSGGTAVRIGALPNAARSGAAPISPDGKRFLHTEYARGPGRSRQQLVISSTDDGKTLGTIDSALAQARWMPSGDAVAYLRRAGGSGNIYVQPIKGGEPKALTHFTEGIIQSFDVTADGKVVVAWGKQRNDVVMIRDFR